MSWREEGGGEEANAPEPYKHFWYSLNFVFGACFMKNARFAPSISKPSVSCYYDLLVHMSPVRENIFHGCKEWLTISVVFYFCAGKEYNSSS